MREYKGRVIFEGQAEAEVVYSSESLLIYGGIDVDTGIIIEHGHPLEGKSVKGKILVFPEAKGSTVGSYTLLQLQYNNVAPAGIINKECEPIVATGVIMTRIPCVDNIEIEHLATTTKLRIEGEMVQVVK